MKNVWFVSDCIFSPLGSSTEENYQNLLFDKTGIRKVDGLSGQNGFPAALLENVTELPSFSRFESISLMAAKGALRDFSPDSARTMFILSSTKGNISSLGMNRPRIHLYASANYIARSLGINQSLVVSNACISGVVALIAACRFLQSDSLDYVLVVGADEVSPFITSGFNSLQALSNVPCKPFDRDRNGISLGEGAGAVLLTNKPRTGIGSTPVRISGCGASNDANHISGPSRTGKELAMAITRSLQSAGLKSSSIDAVCAHGTGTVFNDEMEAKAFAWSGLTHAPIFGLKGYFGHTLGAAGVIETIIAKHALMSESLIATKGYHSHGVSKAIRVTSRNERKILLRLLKTASGFGGCNAALILEKTT